MCHTNHTASQQSVNREAIEREWSPKLTYSLQQMGELYESDHHLPKTRVSLSLKDEMSEGL